MRKNRVEKRRKTAIVKTSRVRTECKKRRKKFASVAELRVNASKKRKLGHAQLYGCVSASNISSTAKN